MAVSTFDWDNILIRLIAALVLGFATYNPSGYSYFHWVEQTLPGYTVPMIFAGIVLLIGWVIFIRATLRSLGALGLILAFAFFGTLLWLVIDMEWVSPNNVKTISYLVLICLSAVLATGMSWSHIRRRMSGQVDVDDVEDKT